MTTVQQNRKNKKIHKYKHDTEAAKLNLKQYYLNDINFIRDHSFPILSYFTEYYVLCSML